MIFLFLSILFNTYLGVIFTYFKKYKIDTFQAIVFNYWTCVVTGSFFLGKFPIHTDTFQLPWFKWAFIMGALFISVFNLIAISTHKVGVTITQTSNKLSLVIPVVFAYFIYHENMSFLKIVGIILALFAVLLTVKKKEKSKQGHIANWEFLLPIILFLSSGVIDTLTKYVERTYLNSSEISNAYLISGFFVAAFLGTLLLAFQYFQGKRIFSIRNLIGGILLGIPNYFSIYFLIKALQLKSLNSSATIPLNNIGIVFLSSLFGIFIFKEKMSKLNFIGLFISIIAIILIYLGDQI